MDSLPPRLVRWARGLVRRLFRAGAADRDLDDELAAYVEAETARYATAGLAPREARRAALLDLEGVEQVKDVTRRTHPWYSAHAAWRDAVTGARALRRSAGFSAVVILTLGLAVGVVVAVFSVMHAVLWRTLPYPDADRLVVVEASFGPQPAGLAPGEVLAVRAGSRLLTSFAVANGANAYITVDDEMARVSAVSASDDMLPLLGGVPMALGRPPRSAEDIRAERVVGVAISDQLWRRLFHAERGVIGRRIQVNNMDVEVVGVLPADLGMWLPASSGIAPQVDVWFPSPLAQTWNDRGPGALARLRPDATLVQVQAEMDALARQLATDRAGYYANAVGPLSLRVRALREVVAEPAVGALVPLGAAVAFVLLIACVNVANLMVARANARQREIATRTALGASRPRIVCQLLAENLVLGGASAVVSLAIASASLAVLGALRPASLPRQTDVSLDAYSAALTIALSVFAVLACGLAPAVRLVRHRDMHSLMSTRSSLSAGGRRRLQRSLVIAEVALSIAPLVAAGLMLRTFINLATAPLGFDSANIVTARVPLSLRMFPDTATRWTVYRNVIDEVRRLPGVDAVSAASALPFDGPPVTMRFRGEGDTAGRMVAFTQQSVMPGYLTVMGTPIVQGRDFTIDDIATRRDVAIVDTRYAQTLWSGRAIGQRVSAGSDSGRRLLEVVGVAQPVLLQRVLDGARTIVRDEGLPHVYVPYHVRPLELSLVVKTRVGVETIGPMIKRTAEARGTSRAVHDIKPMSAYVSGSLDSTRFTMTVLAAFAVTSLLLATIGLYGTLTYLIAQRTAEFGVRLALGASARQIVGTVAKEGLTLTGAGLVLGLGAALVGARALGSLLYGVAPVDPVTGIGVGTLFAVVAVTAILRPAWRAAHIDPNSVLRED